MTTRNDIKGWWLGIFREVRSHTTIYVLLTTILLGAFFVRAFRVQELLAFYFDQGRDALVIWKLWHEGKPFLIGPVTGLAGIFLGPFYYYLIAPFYLIGGGNPAYPAIFLAFISTLGVFMLYFLGAKFLSRETGLIAATIGSFSYFIVLAGRWLANPTPILLSSMLLLWFMWELAKNGNKRYWYGVAIMVGVSMHFESASAIFYIPMVLIFIVWYLIKLYKERQLSYEILKVLAIAGILFFLTLTPQIAFNFKHENILLNNIQKIILEEKSFSLDYKKVISWRLKYFWGVFSYKIFPGWVFYAFIFSMLSFFVLIVKRRELRDKYILPLLILFIGIPMVGYTLYQGNYGNIYDYYMTGYYLPMILFFSLGLGLLWKTNSGKIAVLIFFILFFTLSGTLIKNLLNDDLKGPAHVSMGNQLAAVKWAYKDAERFTEFNVDVYVPPVIPHSYDYLFKWIGTKKCGNNLCGLVEERRQYVYTLFEQDPPHPERLENWISRYYDTSEVEEEFKSGGITVQRRRRI